MKKQIQNPNGMTFVELVVSIAIMFIVASASYELLEKFYRNYQVQEAVAEMQQQARVAVDLISREMSFAGLDPKGVVFPTDEPNPDKKTKNTSNVNCKDGTYPAEKVLEATPTVFHYLADMDGSGTLNSGSDTEEDIRYEWVGKTGKSSCNLEKPPYTLYRDDGGGGQAVAENVVYFKLTYFDENEKGLTDLSKPELRVMIRKVVITVCTQTNRPYPETVSIATSDALQVCSPETGHGTRMMVSELWLRNM